VRYERVRSRSSGDLAGIDTHAIVPRVALAYDVDGTGRLVLRTTYGHYSGRYDEKQIGANSSVGNPDRTVAIYLGPPGKGRDFSPGFDPANYRVFTGVFPTANVRFNRGLSAPITREFTESVRKAIGTRGYGEATYIWRRTTHVVEDFIDLSNGATTVERSGVNFGAFTNIVYRNSDVPRRRYQAIVLQGHYEVRGNWSVSGSWTIEVQNHGNYEGEGPNLPGMTSSIGNFPEGFDPARNEAYGRLQGFERHRVRLWSIYSTGAGRFGNVSLSGLLRVDSGRVYSLVAVNQPLTGVQLRLLGGYPDPPFSQRVYFGSRGARTFPGCGVIDMAIAYDLPSIRKLRPWIKIDVFNLFNNQKVIGFDTTVFQDPSSPKDPLGLATGYIKGSAFGRARSSADFPQPRTLRLALGVRF
jgi:hypothetical protein